MLMRRVIPIIVLVLLLLSVTTVHAAVNGTVYQDLPVNGSTLNTYGIKDVNEPGIANITVTVQGVQGSVTTQTDADGNWQVTDNLGGNVRVSFSGLPVGFASSPVNTGSNTRVQFIADGESANLGLHDPDAYHDTVLPDYVGNLQQNGSGVGQSTPSIQTMHYDDTGLDPRFTTANSIQGTGPQARTDTTLAQTGALWGKAYHKEQRRLFAASVLQRHIGFAQGIGHVFVVDYPDSATSSFVGSFDLQGVVPVNSATAIDLGSVCRDASCISDAGNTGILADYVLSADVTAPNVDLDAFGKVGKVSYGDIELDHSTNTLWLVNLKQKALISLTAAADFNNLPNNVQQYAIESLPNVPTCTGGELRPWALTMHRQQGYLGAVCDAASSQQATDLQAYVLKFDPSDPEAGFSDVLNFPLDYSRVGPWNAWKDANITTTTVSGWPTYPQPILSDIEFDEHNTMYLSILDRYSIQAGFVNYPPISGTTSATERVRTLGELLRACYTNGSYELEGTGSCTQTNNADGEFFDDTVGDAALEGSEGALALLKGSKQLLATMLDPHPQGQTGQTYWYTHGTVTYNTSSGLIDNWYTNIQTTNTPGYNGKGTGIGDIELITSPAPLEIGNRVWIDLNGNGLQDVVDPVIVGTTVTLSCDMQTATTTTDAQGQYLFKDGHADIVSWSQGKIPRNANCELSIANSDATLQGRSLTSTDAGADDTLDNDGILNADKIIKTFNTGNSGYNNHSYDFGFLGTTDLELQKTANVSSAQPGETVVYTLTVRNAGTDPATDVQVIDQLPSGVTYISDDSSGAYDANTGVWAVGGLDAGEQAILNLTVSTN